MRRPKAKSIVGKHLVAGSMALVYGPSGVGKSFFSLDLALSVATGRTFLGKFSVKQANVLYLVSEADGCFPVRFEAYEKHHGINIRDISTLRLIPEAFNFQEDGVANDLASTLPDGWVPEVVVVDTLFCNLGGDENAPKDMGNFVKTCHAIKNKFAGASVLIVHHEGKDKSRGGRGHSALAAACQSIIQIDGEPEGSEITIRARKLTNGKPFGQYVLAKTSVVIDPLDLENGDSIVLTWTDKTPENADQREIEKLKAFTSLFDSDVNKAETLTTILGRHSTTLYTLGWNAPKTMKNRASDAVAAKMLDIHPDDKAKKGIAFRYYRLV